ncbi:oxidoreductase [Pseudonocardia sp. ICBG1122]|nr:oxidoreductase [Pseudonocardia pini]
MAGRGPEAEIRTDRLVILDKSVEADGVVSLSLARPDLSRLPDWEPGAHIDLTMPPGHTRQYSLCGDRWDPARYRIAVLREPDGRGASTYVHDELNAGAALTLGGPRNNFPMVPSARYVFIAGGIGITPILPMIVQAEQVGSQWTLLYGGRRRSSMAFLDELEAYPGERIRVVAQDEAGLLPLSDVLGEPRSDTVVYCCGPAPLLSAVAEQMERTEWQPHRLRTERFAMTEVAPPVRDEPFELELARTGVIVTVPPPVSVLEAARRAGATTLSSCGQGVCGTCETTVLAGTVDHRDSVLNAHERSAGDAMFPCVSRAAGDRLVLDL